jgi:uncharacterized coiled-coil protein SlyX
MFAPEPEIYVIRQVLNRLCDLFESRLDDLEDKQRHQEERIDNLQRRVTCVESKRDRSDEIEHLANWYSPNGDPICNYFTSRADEGEES